MLKLHIQKLRPSFVYPLLTLSQLLLLTHDWPVTFAYPSSSGSTYGRDRFYSNSKCIDSESGRELYVGDSFTRSGRCIRVQCLGDLELWQDRCQVPSLEGNCHRVPAANEFLDYPRCCPTYECRILKTDENSITDENRIYNHYGNLLREHITQRVRVLVKPPLHLTTSNYTADADVWNREHTIPTSSATSTNSMRRDNVFEIKYN